MAVTKRISAFRSGIGDGQDLKVKLAPQLPVNFSCLLNARGILKDSSIVIPEQAAVFKIDVSGTDYISNDNQWLEYHVVRYPYHTVNFDVDVEVLAPGIFEWSLEAGYHIFDDAIIGMEELLGSSATWRQFDHTDYYSTTEDANWELVQINGENMITNHNNTYGLSGFYDPADITNNKTDFTFDIDFATTSSDDDTIGIFFGFKNDGDFYSFQIDGALSSGGSHYMGITSYRSGLFRYKVDDWSKYNSFDGVKQLIMPSMDPNIKWDRSSVLWPDTDQGAKWHRLKTTISGNNVKIWLAKLWPPQAGESHVMGEFVLMVDYTDPTVSQISGAYGPCNASQPETFFRNLNVRSIQGSGKLTSGPYTHRLEDNTQTTRLSDNKMSHYFDIQGLANSYGVTLERVAIDYFNILFSDNSLTSLVSTDGIHPSTALDAYPYVIPNPNNPPVTKYTGRKTVTRSNFTELDLPLNSEPILKGITLRDTYGNVLEIPTWVQDMWLEEPITEFPPTVEEMEQFDSYEWTVKVTNKGTSYAYFSSQDLPTNLDTVLFSDKALDEIIIIPLKDREISQSVLVEDIIIYGGPIVRNMPSFSKTESSLYVLRKVNGIGNAVAKFQSGTNTTADFPLPQTTNRNDKIEIFISEEQGKEFPWVGPTIYRSVAGINRGNKFESVTTSIPVSEFNIPFGITNLEFKIQVVGNSSHDGTSNLARIESVFTSNGSKTIKFGYAEDIRGASLLVTTSSSYSTKTNHSFLSFTNLRNTRHRLKPGERKALYSFSPSSYNNLFDGMAQFYVSSDHPQIRTELVKEASRYTVYATLPYQSTHEWPIELHSGHYYLNESEHYMFASPATIEVNGDSKEDFVAGDIATIKAAATQTKISILSQCMDLVVADIWEDSTRTNVSLLQGSNNLIVSRSNNQYVSGGVLTTKTMEFDERFSSWKPIELESTMPANTDILLEIRTSQDGITWSGWSTPIRNGETPNISASKYIQFRITLKTTGKASPTLSKIRLPYKVSVESSRTQDYSIDVDVHIPADGNWHEVGHLPFIFKDMTQMSDVAWSDFKVESHPEGFTLRVRGNELEARYNGSQTVSNSYRNSISNRSVNLPTAPKQGAPIIVLCPSFPTIDFRQVTFEYKGEPTLTYSMKIDARQQNKIYLDHANVENVVVTQEGKTIRDFMTGINYLHRNEKWDGIYHVSYQLKNSFYVHDNKVQLSANYKDIRVVYENAKDDAYNKAYEIALNPIYSPVTDGFIYITDSFYPVEKVKLFISPDNTLAKHAQPVVATVTVLDRHDNPVPKQQVKLEYNNDVFTQVSNNHGQATFVIKNHPEKSGISSVVASCNNLQAKKELLLYEANYQEVSTASVKLPLIE